MTMQISSTANPRVKFIRKLREKRTRQESGLFYIEGLRIVIEAFEKGAAVESLVVNFDLMENDRGRKLVEEAKQSGREILEVTRDVFESIALKENPQGLAAVVRQQSVSLQDVNTEDLGLWTALDEIADPGNLGTVMRTLDAVGGRGVVLIGHCVDPYDPSTVRASMGALFSLKIVKTDVDEFSKWKQEHGIWMAGSSDKASDVYTDVTYPRDLILLMGSEREGMQAELEKLCDKVVCIPMAGSSDSLNLAIANAVILYEIFKQTHGAGQDRK